MDFAIGIQENLLAILCYDEDNARLVKSLVPAKLYSRCYRELFEAGVAFLDKYDRVAGEHMLDEAERLALLRPKDRDVYLQIFRSIEELSGAVNTEYILSRANLFAEYQTLVAAATKAIETLQLGTEQSVMETRAIYKAALEESFETFDEGLELADTERFMRFTDVGKLQCWPTGIKEFDVYGLCPTRKRLHVLGAPYGRGKSWWLTNIAKHCFMHRARILYIPLEMGEEETCERIAMNFFGYGKIDDEHEFFEINNDENGRILDLERVLMHAPNLNNSEDLKELRTQLKIFQNHARFIIKAWSSGKFNMRLLEAYLDNIAAKSGFVPDIIFIDYLAICEIKNAKDKRLELGQLAVDFRGICQERNCAGVTVAQMNRAALSVEIATGEQVGEDFSIAHHADFFFTYNQTKQEAKMHLARIWVDKGRPTKSKFTVLITQDYGRGQFAISSGRMSDTYKDIVKELVGDDDGD